MVLIIIITIINITIIIIINQEGLHYMIYTFNPARDSNC